MDHVPQNALDPCYDLVTRGVGGFVEVDHARTDVLLEVSRMGGATVGNRSVMCSANEEIRVVLEQQRPLVGVDGRRMCLWLDDHVRATGGRYKSHCGRRAGVRA
jgi:hypothetical protein